MTIINTLIAPNGLSKGGDGVAPYLTFVSGRTGDELNAAFGVNNEDYAIGVGPALAEYADFKEIDGSFENLSTCLSADDIINNPNAIGEILNSPGLLSLFLTSADASNLYFQSVVHEIKSSNETRIDNVTFTQAHIDGTIPVYIEYELYGLVYAGYNIRSSISLNNVYIEYADKDHTGSDSWLRDKRMLNLADYGITTPGTYELKCVAYSGITAASQCKCKFITGKA